MAIKIPQNIDKEDKLIGPLTLKQFLYILGGGGVTFIVYQYYLQGYLFFSEFLMIGIVIMLLALAFAFAKINGATFISFISHVFTYVFSSKRSTWGKDNQFFVPTMKIKKNYVSPTTNSKDSSVTNKSQLEKLAQILDTGGKMNLESSVAEHEITTLNPSDDTTPNSVESKLGVEDILSDTEI